MSQLVGTSVKRKEDPRFIQGKGKYVANLQLPNEAALAIKRSPHAHAKIVSINTTAAAALPGVIAVFTGQDFIDGGVGKLPCGWLVPGTKVPTRWPVMPVGRRKVSGIPTQPGAETPPLAVQLGVPTGTKPLARSKPPTATGVTSALDRSSL